MLTYSASRILRSFVLLLLVVIASGISIDAQTPTPSPSPSDLQDVVVPPGPLTSPALQMPKLPAGQEARPVPPLPDLSRLGIASGPPLSLTMNDAIRRALENNNDIQVAREDVRINEQTLKSLEGIYDPVFSVTPRIVDFTQSTSQPFSGAGGFTIQSRTFQVNSELQKLFSTGGGTYTLFSENDRNTSNTALFNPSYSPVLGVRFTQPLLRDRSIDRSRHDIRVQKKRLDQSDADFRRQTIDIITQVQRAYWDLVFALRDQQNRIANLNLTRESMRRVEAQIAAGSAAPLARAEVQTELANRESDLLLATQTVSIAENALKQLMLKEPTAAEWTEALLPTDQPTFDSKAVLVEDALREATANRPELRRLRTQQEINAIDVQFFKNQTRPRIDIVSTLSLNGLAGTPRQVGDPNALTPIVFGDPSLVPNAFLLQQINIIRNLPTIGLGNAVVPLAPSGDIPTPDVLIGGFGRAFSNMFGQHTHTIDVGVTIQFPIRNRSAEADLASARIQGTQLLATMRSQEQAIVVEVRNAAQNV